MFVNTVASISASYLEIVEMNTVTDALHNPIRLTNRIRLLFERHKKNTF